MNKMHSYQDKLETQLHQWKSAIDNLEKTAIKATGETKAEMMKAIEELRQKKETVKEKWNALQKESGHAWEEMKAGLEKSASELKSALDKVITRFK